MSANWITCAMCGHRYDPAENVSCRSCPVNVGCNLVCCPVCGYSTVDPGKSRLARAASGLFSSRGRRGGRRRGRRRRGAGRGRALALSELPVGARARLVGFAPGFPENRRQQLTAYGLARDRTLEVIQCRPVTVVQVEHTELALERELAEGVQVVVAQAQGEAV